MKNFFAHIWSFIRMAGSRIGTFAKKRKIVTGVIVIVLLAGGYWAYSAIAASATTSGYSLTPATQADLDVTLTDSGQVSAEHQLSLSPKASGSVTSVNVVAGQSVAAGTVIATIDSTDADNSVQTARENLTAAQISYKQAITSSQNSNTNDQNTLRTQVTDTSNDITTETIGVPAVMNGLDTILHSIATIAGFNAEENIDAYANYINSTEAHRQRDLVANDYQAAATAYQNQQSAVSAFDAVNATPAQTDALAASTLTDLQTIATSLLDTLTYFNYINDQIIAGGRTAPATLSTNITTVTGYLSTINGDITTLENARTSLLNAEQTLNQDTQTLAGSSMSLSAQSAQLNLQKAQDALAQAEQTEEDYVVRAPFDGVIGSVAVKQYDQASSGTSVAVLITKQNFVTLSVNEADASQLAVGQKASVTFDAIDGLTVNGTVAEIDQVGTVSQGVATYTVDVGFDSQDPRIKPGMTAEATITTASAANAIQVPSAAVHTTNGSSYVEVATFTGSSTAMMPGGIAGRQFGTASSTNRFRNASSTAGFGAAGSSTGSSTFSGVRTTRAITVTASQVKITRVPVTIGISNDTMVQITSGLNRGQLVVTATTKGSTKSGTASSGSILNLLGGKRATTGATGAASAAGGTRTYTGGAGAAGAFGGGAGGARAGGFGG